MPAPLKSICWLLSILVFCHAAGDADAAEPLRGRLWFLGVAYDESPAKGLTVNDYDYAPDNFSALLRSQSADLFSEVRVEALKGLQATREAVLSRLRGLQAAAPEDLVFVYWGTHGGTANNDWEANLPGNSQIRGSEIKAELARLKCPALVIISTCGSGSFIRPTPRQVNLPENMAAFCACRRRQSTNNELDVTLLEALSGFGDLNQDGHVTLKEALHYVPRRYRRLTRSAGGNDTEPVIGHAPNFDLDRPLSKVNPQRVAVVSDGRWYGAQIVNRTPDKLTVHFLGWDSTSRHGPFAFPDAVVKHEAIDLPGGYPPVEVEWQGTWYPATILESRGTEFQIHYVGYPDTDNETVPTSRIRFPFVGSELGPDRGP